MIVDTHQHLGRSLFTGVETTTTQLLEAMDRNGVHIALVMPQPTRDDLHRYHDRIASAVHSSQGRLVGMASIDPWWKEEQYDAEAERCVRELGFVALKLHPLAHNVAPDHPAAAKVFATADRLQVPVIVHTGLGTPWSLPSLCIPAARKHPHLPIILAHAGWGVYSSEAIVTAEVCENVYLEPSWCPSYVLAKIVQQFGAERVLFGSDHLTNMPVELTKFRSIGLTDTQMDQIFERNPISLFRLEQEESS